MLRNDKYGDYFDDVTVFYLAPLLLS